MQLIDRPAVRRWAGPLALATLVLASGVSGTGNRFTQDDLPLVLRNETVHTLSDPLRILTQPYWHDPFPPSLYRPLATGTLALEWSIGRGSPTAFRWGSLILLFGAAWALFMLGRLILPAPWAWTVAALFAVHPVHVEALAPAVNQGELAVGLLAALATALYIRARRTGSIGGGTALALVLAYLSAALFKENGLILPGLLLAAEGTVLRRNHDGAPAGRDLRRLWLLLGLAGAAVLAVRSAVLSGEALGAPPAEALAGATMAGRALTMLAVVPHWFRLLFWPAHLQADYGPNEIAAATGWGIAQWTGVGLLVLGVIVILRTRTTRPVIAFGLLWIGVALLPVSNVLVPTGIVLAERALFLASCGAMLLIGGALAAMEPVAPARLGLALAAAGILLGGLRSGERLRDWRDQRTLLRQTVADAPMSYTAHLAYSRFLEDSAGGAGALDHFRQAVALKPALPAQERYIADRYREAGLCEPALRRYRRLLELMPGDSALRSAITICERGQGSSGAPRGSARGPIDFDSARAKP